MKGVPFGHDSVLIGAERLAGSAGILSSGATRHLPSKEGLTGCAARVFLFYGRLQRRHKFGEWNDMIME